MTIDSSNLFNDANDVLVGGVNSPVRAYKAVGGDPIFIQSGKGAHVVDTDGKRYIDYVLSYGPLLAGHAHEALIADLHNAILKGTSFGAPTTKETALAKAIRRLIPSCEKLRFVNSGTEAAMSAIRLARGFTKRSIIVKFDGCYHGHADALLVSAGSGALTLGKPSSAGVPSSVTDTTLVLPYNDCDALRQCFKDHGKDIAVLAIEPVCGNMGVIPASPEFLALCRELCTTYGSCLLFDEVMTGFRVHKNGAQGLYGIKPDVTCLGKVIGGGLPCAAYGGREDIMDCLAPIGDVYQAGTLSGNPIAMAAGLSMMSLIEDYGVFERAEDNANYLVKGLLTLQKASPIPIQVQHVGTMFTIFFSKKPIHSLADVNECDFDMFKRFFHFMVANGVMIPPSQYEANFVSSEHTQDVCDHTLAVIQRFLHDYSLKS